MVVDQQLSKQKCVFFFKFSSQTILYGTYVKINDVKKAS